jgi:hypothetical protein
LTQRQANHILTQHNGMSIGRGNCLASKKFTQYYSNHWLNNMFKSTWYYCLTWVRLILPTPFAPFPKICSKPCKLLGVKFRRSTKLCRNFEGMNKKRKRKHITKGLGTQGASHYHSRHPNLHNYFLSNARLFNEK